MIIKARATILALVVLTSWSSAAHRREKSHKPKKLQLDLKTPGQDGRIVTGNEGYLVGGSDVTTAGQYPWQCSMRLWGSHRCGCSLIHPEFVVTAAHCNLDPVQGLEVYMGSNLLYGNGGTAETYQVQKKIPHPDFVLNADIGMPNDIMLLKLAKPANLSNPNIAIIPVPKSGQDFIGLECNVSGWGAVKFSKYPQPYPKLQEAETAVMSNRKCIAAFDADSIRDTQLCSIQSGSTPCVGDSGGPLVCKVGAKGWQQAGVISWGEDCRTDLPSVYTRLSAYRDWLSEHGALVIDSAADSSQAGK